jgi:hypothetical protein
MLSGGSGGVGRGDQVQRTRVEGGAVTDERPGEVSNTVSFWGESRPVTALGHRNFERADACNTVGM